MLDMLAPGRFEWGTGRGSSSEEVFGFGIESMDITREMYDEALPQIIEMMGPEAYGPYEGRFFSMPRNTRTPAFDDSCPPSNATLNFLRATDGRSKAISISNRWMNLLD